jgi:hypothetical protein
VRLVVRIIGETSRNTSRVVEINLKTANDHVTGLEKSSFLLRKYKANDTNNPETMQITINHQGYAVMSLKSNLMQFYQEQITMIID